MKLKLLVGAIAIAIASCGTGATVATTDAPVATTTTVVAQDTTTTTILETTTTTVASMFGEDMAALTDEGLAIIDQVTADFSNPDLSWEETGRRMVRNGTSMQLIADDVRAVPASGEEVRIRDLVADGFSLFAMGYIIGGEGLQTGDVDSIEVGTALLDEGTALIVEATRLIGLLAYGA